MKSPEAMDFDPIIHYARNDVFKFSTEGQPEVINIKSEK